MPTTIAKTPTKQPRVAAVPSRNTAYDAAVRAFREELQMELRPRSALQRAAVDAYIDVECQRYGWRLIRDRFERTCAKGAVWDAVRRALILNAESSGETVAEVNAAAAALVCRWSAGDVAARDEILALGIDLDAMVMRGIAANLSDFADIERQQERLAARSRLLLSDIERTRDFTIKRRRPDISDAEIID